MIARMAGVFLLAGLAAASIGRAEADAPSVVQRLGQVVIVEVTIGSRPEVDTLTQAGYDVANVSGNRVTIYATPVEVQRLRASGYTVRAMPSSPQYVTKGAATAKTLGVYRTYEAFTALLQDYATRYGARQSANPDICRLTSLGRSIDGRELWAMLITDNPDIEEDEPEFKYVGGIHGDEPPSMELCVYFIDWLLTNYGSETRATQLVSDTAIWIVPLMNPDGYVRKSRYNAAGYDLNRNFPRYPADYTGNLFDGEPLHDEGLPLEIQHVMRWTAENSFVLSANFHAGSLVVNYPYDEDGVPSGTDAPSPDDLLFEEIARRYSSNNLPMWLSTEFTDGITNGAAWYAVFGSMQDWNYRYAACNEVTIEVSYAKWPPESTLPTLWANNREAMIAYLQSVHMGVRGIVTSAASGQPLYAKVSLHSNRQPVFTDPSIGDYHRMLLPGVYTMTFTAPGHMPLTVTDIEVSDGKPTRLDIVLAPLPYDADVNGDGVVDVLDVQLVINAALGLDATLNCDIDGNGAVDAVDVQLVLNADLVR